VHHGYVYTQGAPLGAPQVSQKKLKQFEKDQEQAGAAAPQAAGQQAAAQAALPQGAGDMQVATQILPQMVAELNNAVHRNLGAKKGKNPEKIKCDRCGFPGHIAVLLSYVTTARGSGHVNANCPLHNAPKPQMIMHGCADNELCFFEMPCTASYKPKMENSRMGRISVQGGILSTQHIVSQLQRLVPVEDY
jgi:hypothetical protein